MRTRVMGRRLRGIASGVAAIAAVAAVGCDNEQDASEAGPSLEGKLEVRALAARSSGPCDIYASAGTPCVAAYSTVRALSASYAGPLYQVRNGSSSTNTGTGGTTRDIGMTSDGYADTATQDAFCLGTVCTFSVLYDQSGNGNHLRVAPAGVVGSGPRSGLPDYESSATKGVITAGGHKVYSLYMSLYEGYRTAVGVRGRNVPIGSAAQGIYELADGTHSGTSCCWDFGNVSTDPKVYGTMDALFFGTGFWGRGAGAGPWMMADFEGGVWAGGSRPGDAGWGGLNDPHPLNASNPSLKVPFALGFLKTNSTQYSLRMADVKTASALTTAYAGALPKVLNNLGGIVLGVSSDNSNQSYGTFYEGAIASGYPSSATELSVMKNIQAVGYSK